MDRTPGKELIIDFSGMFKGVADNITSVVVTGIAFVIILLIGIVVYILLRKALGWANKIPMIGLNLIPEIANLINNITTSNDKQQENIQNVTINADFPNANSAEEIEKALNNLVNAASQRASKNRRSF